VFSAYLSYLRELTPKRLLLVDVKYNSTHHLNGPFRETAEPTIFQSWKTRGIAVLHLTRRNVLRCVVSGMKAWESKRFDDLHGRGPADGRIHLPPTWTLARLEAWAAEDERMAAAFRDYERYKRVEYTDLFPDANGSIARGPLHDLAEWFGVPADGFRNRSVFHKQSSLPLDETIKNFPRIEAALRGTPFEAFLEDEPAYRKPAAVDR
jgi:hypothetical protein